jgi:hypothetical protein
MRRLGAFAPHLDVRHPFVRDVLLFDQLWRSGLLDAVCAAGDSSHNVSTALAAFQVLQRELPSTDKAPAAGDNTNTNANANAFASALRRLNLPSAAENLTALAVQTLRDHSNATRRASVQAGTWHDPWLQARQAIVTVGRQLIHERQQELDAAATQTAHAGVVNVFKHTKDLMEAAGCVLECGHLGNPLFRKLYRSLQDEKDRASEPVRKWEMLRSGCFSVNASSGEMKLLSHSWPSSKRNNNRFRDAHGTGWKAP